MTTTIFKQVFDFCVSTDGMLTTSGKPASAAEFNERHFSFKIGHTSIEGYSRAHYYDDRDGGIYLSVSRDRRSSKEHTSFDAAKKHLAGVIRTARQDIEAHKRGVEAHRKYIAARDAAISKLLAQYPALALDKENDSSVIYKGQSVSVSYSESKDTLTVSMQIFGSWRHIPADRIIPLIDAIT